MCKTVFRLTSDELTAGLIGRFVIIQENENSRREKPSGCVKTFIFLINDRDVLNPLLGQSLLLQCL